MSDQEKLDLIIKKIENIEDKLLQIENETSKMSAHIDFISTIYEKYKNGLDLVHNFFSNCKK